jgi:formylglycine-generating enzyme required for sulfatase activity
MISIALCVWGAASLKAQEPARIALLIGNQSYADKVGPLTNPHNDVGLIKAALERVGFKVTVVKDADTHRMDAALKQHVAEARKAGPGTISFFYYSGHGVANPDTHINYLVPVDISDASDPSLWDNAFEQSDVIEKLSRKAPQATHYVVFDACRNELRLPAAGQKTLVDKGFAPVADNAGLLIAYSTGLKQTASDVGDGGGPYARALAAEIVKPGVESVMMFRNVQLQVKQSIGQDPWVSYPSLPEIYLAGRGTADTAKAGSDGDAGREWAAVNQNSVAMLETFVKRHGSSRYADYARARITELKQQTALVIPPAKPPVETSAKPVVGIWPEPAGPTVGETLHDCAHCPEMVVVPAGNFMMGSPSDEPERESVNKGSESPQHRVTISKPFAVGKFAVTVDEFKAFVRETNHKTVGGCYIWTGSEWKNDSAKSFRSPGFEQDGSHPVVCVSWDDAKAYVTWLSGKTGQSYRLLSEAEREYVARAGTTAPFWWGRSITLDQANYDGSVDPYEGGGKKGEYRKKTVPVKSFTPNRWGLYQVHGNVWEWTEDCWNANYDDAPTDGSANTTGDCSKRVVRGGSWSNFPRSLRAAYRGWDTTGFRYGSFGFRVARTLNPAS